MDDFSKQSIEQHLKYKFNIIFLNQTESTNTYLKNLASNAACDLTVVIANNQTKGRGRFDRHFHSIEQGGIYMSILIRPNFTAKESVNITAAAAVSVCEAIEALSNEKPEIKWVNDILINKKKVCGILTEGSVLPKTNRLEWAIVGIGVNVFAPENDFEPEIKDIAGAVFKDKSQPASSELCAEILNQFYKYYKIFSEKIFLEPYRQKSAVIGKQITVIKPTKALSAKALDIDNQCRLLVEYENGQREYLCSGEISTKI